MNHRNNAFPLVSLGSPSTPTEMDENDSDEIRIPAVREAMARRADRTKFLPAHLFADPAWDMLLDLYYSDLMQRRITISSLCIASNVPATTALRWIKALQADGLISRQADPLDGRRHFVALTSTGMTAMKAIFSIQRVSQEAQTPAPTLAALTSIVQELEHSLRVLESDPKSN